MTTPSGNITLGDVAAELGAGKPITLGDARVRALAGVPSGPISLGQLRNKTNGPTHPPSGQLLNTFCNGVDKWGNYANGSGGTYQLLIQAQSTDCGWQPNPTASSRHLSEELLSRHHAGDCLRRW